MVVVRGLGGKCFKLDDEVPEEEDDVEPDPNPPEEEEDAIDVDGDEIIPISKFLHLETYSCSPAHIFIVFNSRTSSARSFGSWALSRKRLEQ